MEYGLWAECVDDESLRRLKEHFSGLEYTLLSKRTIRLDADIYTLDGEHGLILFAPVCLNGYEIETIEEALETNETAMFLYHRLRTAPDFRYAYIGWNPEHMYKASDLHECVKTMSNGENHWGDFECVIDDELFEKLGSPVHFWQFRPGYRWQKFRGEEYNPLNSTDQKEFLEIGKSLLPDLFDWQTDF